jgi:hypothetical protein
MGSRGSKPPSFTWKDLEVYAVSENLKPLDVGRLIHRETKPEIKTKFEIFMMYGIIHRLLETIKPKKIKSDNHKWFLRSMPEGTRLKMDGKTIITRPWRTNETYLHFAIAHLESKKVLSKIYLECRKKYNWNRSTTNINKTIYRMYSEAMLDPHKRKIIKQWSIPVDDMADYQN